MTEGVITQPHAAEITEELAGSILRTALGEMSPHPSFTLRNFGMYSNDVAEARLQDGRAIMIKRGRYPWSAGRFRVSRLSAALLRERAGLVAPCSIDFPSDLGEQPLDAYWRIEHPTLAEVWPSLTPPQRRAGMRSLGRMIARVHAIDLPGHGELTCAVSGGISLAEALEQDLMGRLMPAVCGEWPGGVPLVDFLTQSLPEVVERAGPGASLLHGDLHMGNVVCEVGPREVSCVGLLDLESARSGPAESDVARLAVMHHALFEMHVEGPWMDWVKEGYAAPLDPLLVGFYTVYHLVELGFYSALVGHSWHADQVAGLAREAVNSASAATRGSGTPARAAPRRLH